MDEYQTAPELPGKGGAKPGPARAPGLIHTTQSTLQEPTDPAEPEEAAEDEYLAAEDPDELNELVENPGDPDGVMAAEAERQHREQDPAPAGPPAKRHKRHWPKVLLVLVIIAAGAFGAYWFGNHQASAPSTKSPAANAPKQQAPATAEPTKHYDSTNFTLGLDYPADWTLSDTTAKLTVTSPALSLTTTVGKKPVHVVVTIQNPQSTIAGYPAGGATAALASDKLSYKQPTAVQRAQTYLSYLGYQSASDLDALYITGDNGYQQGQTVPMSDVAKGNPLVSVTFETCTTDDCASGPTMAVTLQASSWPDSVVSHQVNALLESMQLN